MRITSKIMQNNQMYNLNNNKFIEDRAATQVATGKKINSPSEDPVVAIRGINLRSTVSDLNQYYQKNSKDAENWLKVTEGTLSTLDELLTDMRKLVVAGPNKYKTLSDWDAAVTQIEALSNEYYATGNADYAGRYIFTGFRTNTPLTFTEDITDPYTEIHDEFNASAIVTSDRVTSINGKKSGNWKEGQISISVRGDIDLITDDAFEIKQDGDKYVLTGSGAGLSGKVVFSVGSLNDFTVESKTGDFNDPELFFIPDGPFHGAVIRYKNMIPTEADIQLVKVGRLRLSYDNIKEENADNISLKYREPMAVPATASVLPVTQNIDTVNLSFTDLDGVDHTIHVPTNTGENASPECTFKYVDINGDVRSETYTATKNGNDPATYTLSGSFGNFTINDKGVITSPASFPNGLINKATASISSTTVSRIEYDANGSGSKTAYIPLSDECAQPYTINLGDGHTVQVNTDGTYTMTDGMTAGTPPTQNVVQVTQNGSIHCSYTETTMKPSRIITGDTGQVIIDGEYERLSSTTLDEFVLNASTGEVLLSNSLKSKLAALENIDNTNTIDVVYDKNQFKNGDTRPENLFTCTKSDSLIYNSGSSNDIMAYNAGYNQVVEVNITAPEIFTPDIHRDVEDLKNVLNKMKYVEQEIGRLNEKLAGKGGAERDKIEAEILGMQKAYDELTETMKNEFSAKITSITKAAEAVEKATTTNGVRARRLELIQTRLMEQAESFRELQEDNEGVDLAETATNLATAELAYQASLQATGKIMGSSLMDFI